MIALAILGTGVALLALIRWWRTGPYDSTGFYE